AVVAAIQSAIIGTDPEVAIPCLEKAFDGLAGERVSRRIGQKSATRESYGPGIGTGPDGVVAILGEGPDHIRRQTIGFAVGGDFSVFQTRYAAALGGDPKTPVGGLIYRPDGFIR